MITYHIDIFFLSSSPGFIFSFLSFAYYFYCNKLFEVGFHWITPLRHYTQCFSLVTAFGWDKLLVNIYFFDIRDRLFFFSCWSPCFGAVTERTLVCTLVRTSGNTYASAYLCPICCPMCALEVPTLKCVAFKCALWCISRKEIK